MPAAGSYSRAMARSIPPAVSVPPFVALHRKLAVHSTDSGLILRPFDAAFRGLYKGQAVRIPWRTTKPESLSHWQEQEGGDGVVVDAAAGLLEGFQDSYLLLITDSAVAATLPDSQASKVLVANSLLAVPLGSPAAARAVLEKHAAKLASRRRAGSVSSVSTTSTVAPRTGTATPAETDDESSSEEDEADAAPIVLPSAGPKGKRPFWQRSFRFGGKKPPPPPASAAVAEVAQADRPLPSVPAAAEQGDAQPAEKDKADDESPAKDPNSVMPPNALDAPSLPSVAAAASATEGASSSSADDEEVRESQRELDQKLVAECLRTMKGLYWSFDTDITRSLQSKHERQASAGSAQHVPQWRMADRRFWWNAHLMQPFVQAGLHAYVTVLQQGFAQHVVVPLPLTPYRTLGGGAADPTSPTSIDLDLVLISRRSTERPGLRYQRRGINGSGGVANFVESEFVVSCVRDGTRHVDSFVQTRGSIPVYWSQSPWALKPPPVLERTKDESREAMKKHVEGMRERYGRLILVNLAEQTGKEGKVVEAYRTGIESLKKDEHEVRYVEFDFHNECRGMRYERISGLIDNIKDDLEELQTFWTTRDETYSVQNGVCRINCIDSLDRTNVVQSAISRYVLNRHLVNLGITSGAEPGMHDELDVAFNEVWANNGDAISREYAGTSALKGDFTRTGKRNWRGAVNDASNSVARLLQSTVSDFFKQAALDYVLGVNVLAFQEFSEKLQTSDPGEILRLAKIRQEAIETSAREVLAEGERRVAAWTLLSPSEPDVVRPSKGGKYEEKVLVLSDKAIYVVSYEFTLQKVSAYTRIPTGDVLSIQHGVYILSSLDASTRDPVENYGFVLRYSAANTSERVHTYSMRTESPKKTRGGTATPASITAAGSPLKPLRLPFSTSRSSSFLKNLAADDPFTASGPSSSSSASSSASASEALHDPSAHAPGETHFFAFKALRRDAVKVPSSTVSGGSQVIDARGSSTSTSSAGHDDGDAFEGKTARDLVRSIVARVRAEAEKVGAVGEDGEGSEGRWEVEKDVISLAESKAATSLYDRVKSELYKAIWL
ncbi:hypothetical protein JCM10207_007343 [Rhodosporidiobolus poonsookiae]